MCYLMIRVRRNIKQGKELTSVKMVVSFLRMVGKISLARENLTEKVIF